MRKNLAIYGFYLSLLGVIGASVRYLGLDTQTGIWAAIGVGCVFAVLWPRW
ncbi:MAG: hypothetical protein IBX71_05145 [Candidatus Desulforudis sp.]|nr:hypothetical protein [Desulforudis sp.]